MSNSVTAHFDPEVLNSSKPPTGRINDISGFGGSFFMELTETLCWGARSPSPPMTPEGHPESFSHF